MTSNLDFYSKKELKKKEKSERRRKERKSKNLLKEFVIQFKCEPNITHNT